MANRTTKLERSLEILVPSEWTGDKKGKFVEDIASQLLKRQSYEVTERVGFTGMEIDLLARHKPSSETVYVECKFLASAVGANVIDLMLGQGFRRHLRQLALFSAGPLSKGAQGAVDDLKGDSRVSFAFYGPEMLLETLVDAGVAPVLPETIVAPNVSHATLLVHPEHPYVWLLQEQMDGRPHRLIPFAPSAISRPSPADIRDLLDKHEVLEGLPVGDYLDAGIPSVVATSLVGPGSGEPLEVVGQVMTADTILDPRPCRPEDFVGRLGVQKEVWDFLSEVRDGDTETRLLALVGSSGYGKSSLVSKLAERFRNKKWKKKYFLYPVDVRSARGPLFVVEALLQAIRSAADADFLSIPEPLCVSDAANILASESITQVLATLAFEKKVLVIFFDQFEEVFTKDELSPVFRVFRRFALDVHGKQPNLVVGFSWRTGVSFTDENQAYQLWNELRDHRLTKTLGKFGSAESSSLVSQFEKALGVKLLPPLRRRIQEQGQGLPWFLKKLCIHVHAQIAGGVSQSDLLGSRLNVEALFDEDLEPLMEAQLSCLRFIASNSPVDSLEVFERYGKDIVDSLSHRRLIIRAGQRFAVYWDIFRDYLTEGKVPAIPWSYIPNGTLGMALAACEVLNVEGAVSLADLAVELSYSEATTVNIITDLQNSALCGKDRDGKYVLLDRLDMTSISDRIRSQFMGHVFYQQLLQSTDESGTLSRAKAIEIVRLLYSGADVKPKTRDNYLARLLPWFEYAGLAEARGNTIEMFNGARRGMKFGRVASGNRGPNKGTAFLANAPPELAERLLCRLVQVGTMQRDIIYSEGLRNSAQDLSFLGLARWSSAGLIATARVGSSSTPTLAFYRAVSESPVFAVLTKILEQNPGLPRMEIGGLLAAELGRDWKPSSALRCTNGLCRYLEYLSSYAVRGVQLSIPEIAAQ